AVRRGDAVPAQGDRRARDGAQPAAQAEERRGRGGHCALDPPAQGGACGMTDKNGTMLYLNGVSVSFDGFKALNSLSIIVHPNEMLAIIGPNGAGKTTMMDIITGKTRPDEGEVLFDGRTDLTKLDEAAIANLGIGRKFQKPTVFES